MVSVEVHRSADRAVTRTGWLESRHSFSYGSHYDAGNTHFGPLLVHNDDVLGGAAGFDEHPHADVEIVSWVVAGRLEHRHRGGPPVTLQPGHAQYLRAGRRVFHAERNADPERPLRFVQAWLAPHAVGGETSYRSADLTEALASGGLVAVASADDLAAPLRLERPGVSLLAGRPAAGCRLTLPEAAYLHLYVVRGAVELDGAGVLGEGDAARVRGIGPATAVVRQDAELLVWTAASPDGEGRP